MEHNFVWTSKDIEGIPNRLILGMELVDGFFKTINLNPDRSEYLMGEEALNPELDTTTVTADWFNAELKVTNSNRTVLVVKVINPAIDLEPTDEDFSHMTNLQIEDGYHYELSLYTHKDLLDPNIFKELYGRHHR